ncbi:hypothetical protein SAMN03159444_00129 [Pseudomonas sp. NFACC02]|nr:hypothetical protein SAMN03159444_00129 [Pseudomonas sp. NFACC02]
MTTQPMANTQPIAMPIIGYGIPFNELIGLPRDTRVCDLRRQLSMIKKGRRIAVRVRG